MTTYENVIEQGSGQPIRVGAFLRGLCSFPMLLGALLIAGVFASTCAQGTGGANLVAEGDTWWHVTTGQRILQTHSLPTADPYSFTVGGETWMAYEWLGETAMALAERLGGLAGLALLLIILAVLVVLLQYYYAYLRSGSWQASFVASAASLPVTCFFFSLRPQLMGYVLLLITLICLERFRTGRQQSLWVLPFIFLVWVNTHGSFVLGLFALGVYWASGLRRLRVGGLVAEPWTPAQRRSLAWVSLASVLALLITPYGSKVAAYPFQMALTQPVNVANIYEWLPLPFDLTVGKMVLGALIALFLAVIAMRPTFHLAEVGLLLPALYAGVVHRRLAFFLVIVLIPIAAALLQRWLPPYRPEIDRHLLNAALMLLIAVAVIEFSPRNAQLAPIMRQKFPVGAVDYLRQQHLDVPMYNEYGWGGFLIWARPESKVFIDGRTDLYEYAGVFTDYLNIARLAPDALTLLRRYGIRACLVEPHSPLSTVLRALPEWRVAYEDKTSTLFVRK